ncbi:hypothetical protein NQ317_017015 [Molorchus minor]|uniref:Uncharacterized protein n=1 Tax=Molorchus minor TaxID=1323400 RepID=A0ABQ9J100_9CUCU|nr:hypothetical protein NQ317_017015 [Molorchus minor]
MLRKDGATVWFYLRSNGEGNVLKGAPPKPQRAYSTGAPPRSSDGPPRPPDRFATGGKHGTAACKPDWAGAKGVDPSHYYPPPGPGKGKL